MITVDKEKLAKLRAEAASPLAGATIDLDTHREYRRLVEVEGMIGGFNRRLESAAARGAELCRLVKLDNLEPGAPAPACREDLTSAAHRKLWDHITSETLEPVIHKEELQPTRGAAVQTSYWIAVKLP